MSECAENGGPCMCQCGPTSSLFSSAANRTKTTEIGALRYSCGIRSLELRCLKDLLNATFIVKGRFYYRKGATCDCLECALAVTDPKKGP